MRQVLIALFIACSLSSQAKAQVIEIGPGEPFIPARNGYNEPIVPRLVKLRLKYQKATAISRLVGGYAFGFASPEPDSNSGALGYIMMGPGITGFVGYEADNSIYIQGDNIDDIRNLIDNIRTLDVKPRSVAVTAHVRLQMVSNQRNVLLDSRSTGLTHSDNLAHLKFGVESPVARGPGSELLSATFDLDLNPRILGDGTIQIDSDFYLDASWRVPGNARPARMKNVYRTHTIVAPGKGVVVTTAGMPLPSGLANLSLRISARQADQLEQLPVPAPKSK